MKGFYKCAILIFVLVFALCFKLFIPYFLPVKDDNQLKKTCDSLMLVVDSLKHLEFKHKRQFDSLAYIKQRIDTQVIKLEANEIEAINSIDTIDSNGISSSIRKLLYY